MSRLREGGWVLPVSLVVALLLGLLPLPGPLQPLRPFWLALVLAYWVIEAPSRAGLGLAFCVGLAADLAYGGLLGQYALRLVIMAFILQRFRARLRFFPLTQQALAIGALLLNDRIVDAAIQLALGQARLPWEYWWAPVLGALLFHVVVATALAYVLWYRLLAARTAVAVAVHVVRCGLGYALGAAAAADVPPERFGVASAVNGAFRQFGAVLGTAILVAIVGEPTTLAAASAAADDGYLFGIVAALLAGGAALALRPRARPASVDPVPEPAAAAATGVSALPGDFNGDGFTDAATGTRRYLSPLPSTRKMAKPGGESKVQSSSSRFAISATRKPKSASTSCGSPIACFSPRAISAGPKSSPPPTGCSTSLAQVPIAPE